MRGWGFARAAARAAAFAALAARLSLCLGDSIALLHMFGKCFLCYLSNFVHNTTEWRPLFSWKLYRISVSLVILP